MSERNLMIKGSPIPVRIFEQGKRLFGGLNSGEMYCRFNNGELRADFRGAWLQRHVQVLSLVAEALGLLGSPTIPPFYVNLSDRPFETRYRHFRTRFSLCSANGFAEVAAPDFVFSGWPEAKFDNYDRKTAAMAAASENQAGDDRAFWAGRCINDARKTTVQMASIWPDLLEAYDTQPGFDEATAQYSGAFKTMEEQVSAYRYMIDVEGLGYSGRFKLLLHTKRAVLLQERPWHEWFFADIEPFRHYVPVARDMSDLPERIEWLRANPKMESEIAGEAQQFARTRLTRSAAVAAWAELLEDHIAAGGNLKSGLQKRQRAKKPRRTEPTG
ncbi:glycosyl transferase family 90 [Mesorhizobium sp. INR15]|uniref:glycosyl transferase family 90 n=1 Tax=Mesorhizobium sp. INR15 TaxID=2654248 RepID=UPI0018963F21|nr:glycosyl transferase family 90 [Mesorhizobium sp. INR15]